MQKQSSIASSLLSALRRARSGRAGAAAARASMPAMSKGAPSVMSKGMSSTPKSVGLLKKTTLGPTMPKRPMVPRYRPASGSIGRLMRERAGAPLPGAKAIMQAAKLPPAKFVGSTLPPRTPQVGAFGRLREAFRAKFGR
jgi:hypothetical protein